MAKMLAFTHKHTWRFGVQGVRFPCPGLGAKCRQYVDPLAGFTPITVSDGVSPTSKNSSNPYMVSAKKPIVVAGVCEVRGTQAALVAQLIKSGAITVERKPKLFFEEWVEDVLGPNSAGTSGRESSEVNGRMH